MAQSLLSLSLSLSTYISLSVSVASLFRSCLSVSLLPFSLTHSFFCVNLMLMLYIAFFLLFPLILVSFEIYLRLRIYRNNAQISGTISPSFGMSSDLTHLYLIIALTTAIPAPLSTFCLCLTILLRITLKLFRQFFNIPKLSGTMMADARWLAKVSYM